MPNFGALDDYGTPDGLLDLSLYESGSITPRTTFDRLVLDQNRDDAHAAAPDLLNPKYQWVKPPPAPAAAMTKEYKPYYENLDSASTAIDNKEKDYESVIRRNEGEIAAKQLRLEAEMVGLRKSAAADVAQYLASITSEEAILKSMKEDARKLEENQKILKPLVDYKLVYADLHDSCVFKIDYQYDPTEPIVSRYGICSKLFNKLTMTRPSDTLPQVEFHALHSAMEYLSLKEAGDIQGVGVYKNNVVLCDIFARDINNNPLNNGLIKLLVDEKRIPIPPGDIPETHTVVLWKISNAVPKSEIMLIDPSGSKFSSIIEGIFEMDGAKIISRDSFVQKFPQLKSKYESFYGTTSSIGRLQGKERDCIDIAVKIGFELNELQLRDHDIESIMLKLHSAMSNEKSSGNAASLKYLRDAHSSSQVERKSFSYLREFVDNDKLKGVTSVRDVFNHKMCS